MSKSPLPNLPMEIREMIANRMNARSVHKLMSTSKHFKRMLEGGGRRAPSKKRVTPVAMTVKHLIHANNPQAKKYHRNALLRLANSKTRMSQAELDYFVHTFHHLSRPNFQRVLRALVEASGKRPGPMATYVKPPKKPDHLSPKIQFSKNNLSDLLKMGVPVTRRALEFQLEKLADWTRRSRAYGSNLNTNSNNNYKSANANNVYDIINEKTTEQAKQIIELLRQLKSTTPHVLEPMGLIELLPNDRYNANNPNMVYAIMEILLKSANERALINALFLRREFRDHIAHEALSRANINPKTLTNILVCLSTDDKDYKRLIERGADAFQTVKSPCGNVHAIDEIVKNMLLTEDSAKFKKLSELCKLAWDKSSIAADTKRNIVTQLVSHHRKYSRIREPGLRFLTQRNYIR